MKGWRKRMCLKKGKKLPKVTKAVFAIQKRTVFYRETTRVLICACTSYQTLATKTKCELQNNCRYCSESYYSDKCPSFKFINERKSKLKKAVLGA